MILTLADLPAHVGEEIGVSDWLTVDQARIDAFADVSGDHQWIHVDPARAGRESPFGATIAHGFLTLSLISRLTRDVATVGGAAMTINYGLNRVRFVSPVPAGARIRARVTLAAVSTVGGAVQARWHILVEREGSERPCLAAEWLTRYYPDPHKDARATSD